MTGTATDSILRNCWWGVGFKVGGGLIAAGLESLTGRVFNALHPRFNYPFAIESARLQAGLGGSGGLGLVFVLDCSSIHQVDGATVTDWGLDLSLGARWSEAVEALTKYRLFAAGHRVYRRLQSAHDATRVGSVVPFGDDAEAFKLAVNYFWNAHDVAKRDVRQPTILTLDTPIGAGAEATFKFYVRGTFNLLPNA